MAWSCLRSLDYFDVALLLPQSFEAAWGFFNTSDMAAMETNHRQEFAEVHELHKDTETTRSCLCLTFSVIHRPSTMFCRRWSPDDLIGASILERRSSLG